MSQLRRALLSFRRGRPFLGPLTKLFRSALELPLTYMRFKNLNASAPAPVPRRNQFWFRAPLVVLIPAVLLVAFVAIRHWHPRSAFEVSAPVSLLQTDWQAALDAS